MLGGNTLAKTIERRGTDDDPPLILLVDDDDIEQLIGRDYFEGNGFRVYELASADDFVPHVSAIRPDLIILDVMMPGTDGFEACRQLRQDPQLAHIPVLMATALDDEASLERAFEVGATDFVVKPISWPLLGHRAKFVLRINHVERELREATRLAQAANHAKSVFLTNMSHELRTPLNAVIGFSEMMQNEVFGRLGDPRYHAYAGDICDSGSHLLAIINDVLDLSKAESGKLELNEQLFDLRDVVLDITRLTENRLYAASLTGTIDLPAALPLVRGDELKTRQMLLNLLSNAIKFTPPGGTVALSVRYDSERGVAITVADTGTGIAEQDLDRVLQPFEQADSSLARTHEGTGLGLPLVNAMIELHGGSLTLKSAIDKGTEATIVFPEERLVARVTPLQSAA